MTEKARLIRKTLLNISNKGGDGNLQSCFSSVEILSVLFSKVLNFTPSNKKNVNRDEFFLSKGQSSLALLVVMAFNGFLNIRELESFCKLDSRISMQIDCTKFDFIENSAGSLGHGFPMSVGAAWAKKIMNAQGRVFCLAGDGEMNEGTMWEAAMFAASEKLNNLVLIIDDNKSIGKMINIESLEQKLCSFGFFVKKVDGHNENELYKAFTYKSDIPSAIIAETKRGYGSMTLESQRSWFHRSPDNNELLRLLKEVEEYTDA